MAPIFFTKLLILGTSSWSRTGYEQTLILFTPKLMMKYSVFDILKYFLFLKCFIEYAEKNSVSKLKIKTAVTLSS